MIPVILTILGYPILYLLLAFRKKAYPRKILMVQTAKIGDLICSTPVLKAVKNYFPHIHLAAMVTNTTRELLEHNPLIDEVIVVDHTMLHGLRGKFRMARMLRKKRFDVAICLNPNVIYAFALVWALIPVRLSIMPNFRGTTFGIASRFFTFLEPHREGQLVTRTYMKMLKNIGIESDDLTKEVYQAEGADDKVRNITKSVPYASLIGIALSSGNKLKELGSDKLIGLITRIVSETTAVAVLIGSCEDQETADHIVRAIHRPERLLNLTGMLTLTELPALLSRLSVFVGVDTGITYMADALSVPIVHLAGPIDTSEQHPTGDDVEIIRPSLPCAPCTYVYKTKNFCWRGTRECIRSLSTDDIWSAVRKMLASHSSSISE
jgi:ADP-heptose:LPS heptosyltransferase